MPRLCRAFFVLSLLITLAMGGCASQRGGSTRVLRIGTDATYPPFESLDNGEFTGFDIELGRAIGAEIGRPVEFVNTSFDGVFPALLAGKFDAVMSSVTVTPERKQRLAFSAPYYTAGQIVAARQNQTAVSTLANLKGKTVGIQINTTAAEVLKPYPNITVRKFPSIDLALQDLQNGNLDGVVGDAPTIRYFVAHGFPKLRTVGTLLTQENYGIALRPKDAELRAQVNQALTRLRANGRFAALESKYFGAAAQSAPAAPPALDWRSIFTLLARGLALTLGLTVVALAVGLPLGLLLALGRRGALQPVSLVCTSYIELFRGTPLLVQIIFVYYALPQLIGLNLPPLLAGMAALALNCAAYMAEIFRAGINSLDIGQTEAARALGLNSRQTLRHVLLPQTVRRVLPPLTNEAIALLKDSSLVSVIGLAELTRSGQELASQLAAPLAIWPAVALLYLLVTLPLTRLSAGLEKKWE